MKTIKPAKNILFCQPDKAEDKTSGFLLTADSVEAPQTATVVATSTDDYAVGDTIVYKAYTTSDIKLEDKEYFLIAVEDVLGVVVDS